MPGPRTITEDDKYYAYQWIVSKIRESMRGAPTSIFDVGKAYEAYHALRLIWPEGGEGSAERLTVWVTRYLSDVQWHQIEQELQLLQLLQLQQQQQQSLRPLPAPTQTNQAIPPPQWLGVFNSQQQQQQSQPASSNFSSLAQQQNSNDAMRLYNQVSQGASLGGGLGGFDSQQQVVMHGAPDISAPRQFPLGPLPAPIQTNQLIPPPPPAQQQNNLAIPQQNLPRPHVTPRGKNIAWDSIPYNQWRTLTDHDAAQILGIDDPRIVWNHRSRHKLPKGPKRVTKYNWGSITDYQWRTLTNRQIAHLLGFDNPHIVAHYRSRHMLPRGAIDTKYNWGSITDNQWRTQTNSQIAQILGIDILRIVSNHRFKHKLPRGPMDTKYNWGSITDNQWRTLTNRQIAHLLGCDAPSVVAHYRSRHMLPKGPQG